MCWALCFALVSFRCLHKLCTRFFIIIIFYFPLLSRAMLFFSLFRSAAGASVCFDAFFIFLHCIFLCAFITRSFVIFLHYSPYTHITHTHSRQEYLWFACLVSCVWRSWSNDDSNQQKITLMSSTNNNTSKKRAKKKTRVIAKEVQTHSIANK